jgi:assimilatory nitrate reductase catalytic subunit
MTRTGASATLAVHRPQPFVEVNPADLQATGLTDGGFARVTTAHGSCVLKVVASSAQRAGSLFVPIHWSDATASSARVGDLVAADVDPHSGQPEAKATPARIAPVHFSYYGFALTRTEIALPEGTWRARVAVAGGLGMLFASDEPPNVWRDYAAALFAACEVAEYVDIPRGCYRVAGFRAGRLDGALFVGQAADTPQWDSVKAMFAADEIAEPRRRILLSGRSADGLPEHGPLVCACFGVSLNVIRGALASGSVASVDDIGTALKAGSNCGSCLPELKKIVYDCVLAPT